jgi:hypothetical protein
MPPSKSPLDKVDLLLKMFGWTQLLIITVAICIPSIIIGLQYSGDKCVIGDLWNIRLDEWLLIASLFQIITIVSFLPNVCCAWKHWCTKLVPFMFIIILFFCFALGIILVSLSNLSNCLHDSLFVMSVIEITFIGIFISTYSIYQFASCCKCKCGSVFDNDDEQFSDDDDVSWWFKQ